MYDPLVVYVPLTYLLTHFKYLKIYDKDTET